MARMLSLPGVITCDLDHVALAVERHADVLPFYVDELGGVVVDGGPDPGFNWSQISYANGMRLELLEPHQVEEFDFLRRFLDRNGPGPHHMTFKVADIDEAIAAARSEGYEVVGVRLEGDEWKEAFLHPKSAPGIVIQLAWTSHVPDAPAGIPVAFDRAVHAVADLDDGLAMFERLLGGIRTGEGGDAEQRWVDLAWPGPGRIRLVEPAGPGAGSSAWLGDRRGRLHHLAFSGAEVADREVAPESNFGTRVVITRV